MARLFFTLALLLAFPLLITLHLYISPYTKVEESFNIQAVRDIVAYGIPTRDVAVKLEAHYDHMTFPGAVPRTFVGAVVLAGISEPLLWLAGDALDGEGRQSVGTFKFLFG